MANPDIILRHIRKLVVGRNSGNLPDQELLQRFASQRDEAAFETLLQRHGPMVLCLCRRVLRHEHDAEDVFQATFLVFAQKAGSIRRHEAVGSWLHKVAYHIAMKSQADTVKRRTRERRAVATRSEASFAAGTWQELRQVLDEELQSLPEKYRSGLVLCYLEGKTRDEAAHQLGWPLGTLKSRLDRGRELLRVRISRRGLPLSMALLATTLGRSAPSATVPVALEISTVETAMLVAMGQAVSTSVISAKVNALAAGVSKAMLITKIKTGLSVVLGLAITVGLGMAVRYGFGTAQAQAPSFAERDDDDGERVVGDDEGKPDLFRDVARQSGVRFTYRNGEEAGHCTVLESLGGGVAVLDYDGDGLLDIFFVGGGYFDGPDNKLIRGHPCKLYKNLGNGKFKDVTQAAGFDGTAFYSHGVAVVDYDRDGWPDLLVTGWNRLALFHNESDGKGGRIFVDVTSKAGLPVGLWSTSAAFADLDGDGFPDLIICQYVNWSFDNHPECRIETPPRREICPPKMFSGLPSKLFRNNGDGTFTDVSQEAGLRNEGRSLGVVIADLDNDGKPDIFFANDTADNQLYRNQSSPGKFRFIEMGGEVGVARDQQGLATGSKGIAIGDFNSSGRLSLFVTNYENELPTLYINETIGGRLFFRYGTLLSGIDKTGQSGVGWGTAFIDYDNDGQLDLFIANGHTIRHDFGKSKRKQRPVLLRNQGNGQFVDVTTQAGIYFQTGHNARGVVAVDLDNDGKLDLIISHVNEPVVILRNQAVEKDHHWIGFVLVGKDHRDVVGAKIIVETNARTQTSFVHSGGSYASSSDHRHLFGLGKTEKVRRIRIVWPRGEEQHWDGLTLDRYWRLTEGKGAEEMTGRR
jgi:RNA polymerase sigma factor (sigma-70 family)